MATDAKGSDEVVLYCVLFCGVLCPFIATPIGGVMLVGHNFVVDLPVGTAWTNNGTLESNIGSISSSTKITGVPIFVDDELQGIFSIRFPPPPIRLNLKGKTEVRQWESANKDTRILVSFDVDGKSGWTEPIGRATAISLIVVGVVVFVLECGILVYFCYSRFCKTSL